MTWDHFIFFAIPSVLLWTVASAWALRRPKKTLPALFTVLGLGVFFSFILGMWISLERPPLRTMGETRLWYSFFLPVAGLITYQRWGYKWILSFSTILSAVFIIVNIAKPDIHNKVLMPALQSPWFAPHVIIYMFSYAILGAVTLVALYYLIREKKITDKTRIMDMTDNLVYVGIAFITMGMLMGAIWAKEAWGHYWSWDPKETWALIVWLNYAAWLHMRLMKGLRGTFSAWWALAGLLVTSFAFLGVNMFLSGLHSYGTL